ncbi:hypothetical protein RJ639_008172 [Escallonia herrerae]|uniref:Reverse transcriptase Ty1/copia-type domain-containing protein n=1 Tax=Escallonia herrerae TaxID=1293975 RepID=A0AA89ARU1_9ASTE|nr:hypothetical protein RJ639_008172 [Escallonia herrerae]
MESHISRTYLFLRTAKAIWDAATKNYSDLENASQLQRIIPLLTSLVEIRETTREDDVRGAVTAVNRATPGTLAGIFTELESGRTIDSARGETLDEDKPWDTHEPEPSPQTNLPNVEFEPIMPLSEQKKILETRENSRPLIVYSCRKQPLNGDKPDSLQGQESEPIPSPDDHAHHDGTDHCIQKGAENLTEDVDLELPTANCQLLLGKEPEHVLSILYPRDYRGELDTLKLYLASEFELKDLGALRYFLGMEVARSKSGITVSQRTYELDLLQDTGMLGCRPVETPMEPKAKMDIEGGKDVDREQYQRLMGKLIYLSHTRPAIAFAVSVINQFMHSPKKKHLDAVYGVLRYLKGTPGKGLFFKRGDDRMVEIYTDADWAGSSVD